MALIRPISGISESVCPITMCRVHDGETVGSAKGSGFFWRREGGVFTKRKGWFLITNWHNVTGFNADTGKAMSAFIPNKLRITARCAVSRSGGVTAMQAFESEFELYNNENPIWIEHPQGRAIDCVAVPFDISAFNNFAQRAINDYPFQIDLLPEVGMECFVVGYPLGLKGRVSTPIWKRGSIATEPELDHDRLPMMLIDTATRKGMSGSPVIIRHHGVHLPTGEITDDSVFGTVENFLGVYSGRVGDDELGGQLGRVWKMRVIEEIFDSGKKGVHPNEL